MEKRKSTINKKIEDLVHEAVNSETSKIFDLLEKFNWDNLLYLHPGKSSKALAEELYKEKDFLDIFGISLLKKEGNKYKRVESYGTHIGRKQIITPSHSLLEELVQKGSIINYQNTEEQDQIFKGKTILSLGKNAEYLITIKHKEPNEIADRIIRLIGNNIVSKIVEKAPKYQRGKEAKKTLELPTQLLNSLVLSIGDIPKFEHLDIYFYTKPCTIIGEHGDEINGDHLYFQHTTGHAAISIVDVKGHGMPAARYVGIIDAYLKAIYEGMPKAQPNSIISCVNRLFCRDAEKESRISKSYEALFATVFYSRISNKGKMEYSNAGHEAPLLLRHGRFLKNAFQTRSPPIGIDLITYKKGTIQLKKGDTLVYITDGVIEASNKKGELYGNERLKGCVYRNRKLDPREMTEAIVTHVKRFNKTPSFNDDFTVVVVKYK